MGDASDVDGDAVRAGLVRATRQQEMDSGDVAETLAEVDTFSGTARARALWAVAETDSAGVRFVRGADRSHSSTFAGPVTPADRQWSWLET